MPARGTTWVYLDKSETVQDESLGRSSTNRDELVEELRDRNNSLERRLDEERESRRRADTIIAQLTQANTALTERLRELEAPSEHDQSSAAPSLLRGSWEEGAKEATRLLVGGIAALVVVAIPSAFTAVISYFNDATTLAVLSTLLAFFGALTGLVGTYFGIKYNADARERSHRIAEEAVQEARGAPRADG